MNHLRSAEIYYEAAKSAIAFQLDEMKALTARSTFILGFVGLFVVSLPALGLQAFWSLVAGDGAVLSVVAALAGFLYSRIEVPEAPLELRGHHLRKPPEELLVDLGDELGNIHKRNAAVLGLRRLVVRVSGGILAGTIVLLLFRGILPPAWR